MDEPSIQSRIRELIVNLETAWQQFDENVLSASGLDKERDRVSAEFAVLGRENLHEIIALLLHPNYRIIRAVALALREIGDRTATLPLVECLKVHWKQGFAAGSELLWALEKLQDPASIEALWELYQSVRGKVGPYDLTNVADVFAAIGTPLALDHMIDIALEYGPEETGRALNLADAVEVARRLHECLADKIDNNNLLRQRAAARALGFLPAEYGFSTLLQLLSNDALRADAIQGLGRTADSQAIEPLAALLHSPDSHVGFEAAIALMAIGGSMHFERSRRPAGKQVAQVFAQYLDSCVAPSGPLDRDTTFLRRQAILAVHYYVPETAPDILRRFLPKATEEEQQQIENYLQPKNE